MAKINDTTWNTGRQYTEHGQIVRARQLLNGTVLFADVSRQVDGAVAPPAQPFRNAFEFRQYVMEKYDKGEYVASIDSQRFYNESVLMFKPTGRSLRQ